MCRELFSTNPIVEVAGGRCDRRTAKHREHQAQFSGGAALKALLIGPLASHPLSNQGVRRNDAKVATRTEG